MLLKSVILYYVVQCIHQKLFGVIIFSLNQKLRRLRQINSAVHLHISEIQLKREQVTQFLRLNLTFPYPTIYQLIHFRFSFCSLTLLFISDLGPAMQRLEKSPQRLFHLQISTYIILQHLTTLCNRTCSPHVAHRLVSFVSHFAFFFCTASLTSFPIISPLFLLYSCLQSCFSATYNTDHSTNVHTTSHQN